MRNALQTIGEHLDRTRLVMFWNMYFIVKLYLYLSGAINLDIALNLVLLLFAVLPAGMKESRSRVLMRLRMVTGVILALLLLWYDSWLPSIADVANLIQLYGLPSFGYTLSFIKGAASMSLVVFSVVVLLLGYLLRSYKRLSIVAIAVAISVSPLLKSVKDRPLSVAAVQVDEAEAAEKDPAKFLESFYAREAERTIVFRQPASGAVPFDLVVLHVCSLSWDDLDEIGMPPNDPFFKEFDYLFTNFNSATGYSGPAVMRLLQSNGGQRSHSDVHSTSTPKEYFLFESLATLGYERYIAMDHDGRYGNFNSALKKNGLNNAKIISHDKLSPTALFFDGKTSLYSDAAIFSKWLEARNSSKSERAALYFNSVLMHAGTHWIGERKGTGRDQRDQFKGVATVFLKDARKIIEMLKASNRNTVLVLVSEHGRALTGSSFQPPDMRDIPLPKITRVPMAIKLIGPRYNNAKVRQTVVDKPTSYFALSWTLSKFLERSPFGPTADAPQELAARIPKTDFVAENETGKIVEIGGQYHYLGKTRKWTQLTPAQLK